VAGLEAWLRSRNVRGAAKLAAAVVDAAKAQTIRLRRNARDATRVLPLLGITSP
jgi:hypothetical protein